MPRQSRARAAIRTTPWPETIRMEVLKHFERSGKSWFPATFWSRMANNGRVPSQVPSLGNGKTINASQDPFVMITVVPIATGAPNEMTPAEIFAAYRGHTIGFQFKEPWQDALLQEGSRFEAQSTVRLSPPMKMVHRNNYERANEIPVLRQSSGELTTGMFAR